MMPSEYLDLMGMHRGVRRFQRLIDDGTLSGVDIRMLAGNGLHCPSIGAALVWAVLHMDVS